MRRKVIKLGFIECVIRLAIVDDAISYRNTQLFKKYPLLGKTTGDSIDGICTYDHTNYPGQFWITVDKKAPRIVHAHESLHCVDAICEHWGFDCTEFRAYLQGYILIHLNQLYEKRNSR